MRLLEIIGATFIYALNIVFYKKKRSFYEILNDNIFLNRFIGGLIATLILLLLEII